MNPIIGFRVWGLEFPLYDYDALATRTTQAIVGLILSPRLGFGLSVQAFRV